MIIQINSFLCDSITLIIINIYLLFSIDKHKSISDQSHEFPFPRVLVILPTALSTINRFSKNRKYDFWVLSCETTFPFGGMSSVRVSFSANCRWQVKSECIFRRTWLYERCTERESARWKRNSDIANNELEKTI